MLSDQFSILACTLTSQSDSKTFSFFLVAIRDLAISFSWLLYIVILEIYTHSPIAEHGDPTQNQWPQARIEVFLLFEATLPFQPSSKISPPSRCIVGTMQHPYLPLYYNALEIAGKDAPIKRQTGVALFENPARQETLIKGPY